MVASNKIGFIFASIIALAACGSGAAPETPAAAPVAGAAGTSSSLPPGSQAGAAGQGQAGSGIPVGPSANEVCAAKAAAGEFCENEGKMCGTQYRCCANTIVSKDDSLCHPGDVGQAGSDQGQAGSDAGKAGSPAVPELDCEHFGAACTGLGKVCSFSLLACCQNGKMGDKDAPGCLPSQGGAGAAGQGQAGNGASGAGTGGSDAAGQAGAGGSAAGTGGSAGNGGSSGTGGAGGSAGAGGSTSGAGGSSSGSGGSTAAGAGGSSGSSTAGAPQGGAGQGGTGGQPTTVVIDEVRIHVRAVKNVPLGIFGQAEPKPGSASKDAIGPSWTGSPNATNTVPNGIDWEIQIERDAVLSMNGQHNGSWDFPFCRYGKATVALWAERKDGTPLPPFTIKNMGDQWGSCRLEIENRKAPVSANDADGDGHAAKAAGGDDCNDVPSLGGHAVRPGQVESFGADINGNTLDLDCDGVADPLVTVIIMTAPNGDPLPCGKTPVLRDVDKWDAAHTYPMVQKTQGTGCVYHTPLSGPSAIPIDQRPAKITASWDNDTSWSSESWKGYCEAKVAFQAMYAPLGTPSGTVTMLGMADKCTFGVTYLYN